jgi:hypothetical protein
MKYGSSMDRVWIVYEGSSLFGVVFNRRDNQGVLLCEYRRSWSVVGVLPPQHVTVQLVNPTFYLLLTTYYLPPKPPT